MSRITLLLTLLACLAAGAPSARATEIEPDPPLSGEIASKDARALLSRWLGSDARGRGAPGEPADPRASLIVSAPGAPALRLPFPAAENLPPLPIRIADPGADARSTGTGPLLAGSDELLTGAVSGSGAALGGTRFDVRPADRNPIALGGDVLDQLTARVVRTPEPGTLALFALGAAALAAVARRRRRGSTADTAGQRRRSS